MLPWKCAMWRTKKLSCVTKSEDQIRFDSWIESTRAKPWLESYFLTHLLLNESSIWVSYFSLLKSTQFKTRFETRNLTHVTQIINLRTKQWTKGQVWPYFGCCTADSQTDWGRNQLYNNCSLFLFSNAWLAETIGSINFVDCWQFSFLL